MNESLEDLPRETLLARLMGLVHRGDLTPEAAAEIFARSKRSVDRNGGS